MGWSLCFCFAYKHTSSNIKNMNGVKGYYVLQPWKLAFVGDDGKMWPVLLLLFGEELLLH